MVTETFACLITNEYGNPAYEKAIRTAKAFFAVSDEKFEADVVMNAEQIGTAIKYNFTLYV